MKIVIISDWFAEKMGYAENCLPKALAALGADVHVVTSDAQIYFDSPAYKDTYEPFIGPPVVACGTKALDGYTLHRLPHGRATNRFWSGRLYIRGLVQRLAVLRPDVVQTFDVACPTTYHAAAAKLPLRFKLFLETHCHASVFSPGAPRPGFKPWVKRTVIESSNRLASVMSEKCYPISTDAADLAVRYFGVQSRKVEVCSLGVDTDLFVPPVSPAAATARRRLREQLGFAESDIVCVYTGRFTPDKGPQYLAQAIDRLVARGLPFRGLFVGSGRPEDIAALAACAGCVVHPFVPVQDLPPFYWTGDIGVWPKQESTSQLDAAACGLPLVLSNRIEVTERIDGNGVTYTEADAGDLAAALESLRDPARRRAMADLGIRKMRDHFSWRLIAARRLRDFEAAVGGNAG